MRGKLRMAAPNRLLNPEAKLRMQWHETLGCAALAACCLATAPAFAAGKTKGFVVSNFMEAQYDGADACPNGPADKPDLAALLKTLSPEERKQAEEEAGTLEQGLLQRIVKRGPGGINVCLNPTAVVDPGLKTVGGSKALGLDLDGGKTGSGPIHACKHQEFTSPDGTPGIDNQLYRVVGCMINGFGIKGHIPEHINNLMRDGQGTIVVEISGIDDEVNDNDVQVGIYASPDPMAKDVSGKEILPDGSFHVDPDPRYHTVVHGKIVNGVVTTDPARIQLRVPNPYSPYDFYSARLRLELLPDGTMKGLLGGYMDWREQYNTHSRAGSLSEVYGVMTCPGYYNALKREADGYPDPVTGECTRISAAYSLTAVPAFVVHTQTASNVASH